MKEGMISVIIGCHSPVHSILVLLAWKKLYGRWPVLWQAICIFLHDVGHWGMDYLTDYEQKKNHWMAGARIAKLLFGQRGFDLVAGHCVHSGASRSDLYKADKYSWLLAPYWWLWTNTVAEPRLRMGYSRRGAIALFRENVRQSIASGEFRETHSFYLERCDV